MDAYQKSLIEDNIKFAYYLASEWSKKQNILDLEELQSICLLSLAKAAKKYDPEKFDIFINYVKLVAKRDIIKEIKKANTYLKHTISTKNNPSMQVNFEEPPIDLDTILEKLPSRDREIVNLYMAGYSQREIAEKLNCVKSTINKTLQDVRFYIKNNIIERNIE